MSNPEEFKTKTNSKIISELKTINENFRVFHKRLERIERLLLGLNALSIQLDSKDIEKTIKTALKGKKHEPLTKDQSRIYG